MSFIERSILHCPNYGGSTVVYINAPLASKGLIRVETYIKEVIIDSCRGLGWGVC